MHTNGLCAARSALITIPSTAPLVRNGAGSAVDASPRGKRRQVEEEQERGERRWKKEERKVEEEEEEEEGIGWQQNLSVNLD